MSPLFYKCLKRGIVKRSLYVLSLKALVVIFLLLSVSLANAANFTSTQDGLNHSYTATTVPGTYSFLVSVGYGTFYYTEWYVNGAYKETDVSQLTNLYANPSFSWTLPIGTTAVKALVYSSKWTLLNNHLWTIAGNRAPTAPVLSSIMVSNVTSTGVLLTWGASNDPDGNSVSYEVRYGPNNTWTWSGWLATNSTSMVLSGLSPNTTYVVEVRAKDSLGLYSTTTQKDPAFTTLPTNRAPSATTVSTTGASIVAGQTYTVTVLASDLDGNLHHIDLNWNDGSPVVRTLVSTNGQSVSFTKTFNSAATVNWSATAYDSIGLSSNMLSNTFNVTSANRAPSATTVSTTGASIVAGQTYTVTVLASDLDGNLHHIDLNWNDGSPVVRTLVSINGQSVSFSKTFSSTGTVNWSSTAYDSLGLPSPMLQGSFNVTSATYPLSVSISGTGTGTVLSSPSTASTSGINCSSGTCSANYNSGASVQLIAMPATGSTFAGWSGGGCSGTGSCTVTMNAAQNVTATFNVTPNRAPSATTVSTAGASIVAGQAYTVTVLASDPDGNLDHIDLNWNDGSPVVRTPVSTNGQSVSFTKTFNSAATVNWSATAYDSIGLSSIMLSGTFNVTSAAYTLSVSISGTGTGTVLSSPSTASTSGINCSSGTCSANYNSGANVQLNATPATGSTFAGWTGGGCSGTGSCTVTLNAAQNVTATFNVTAPVLGGLGNCTANLNTFPSFTTAGSTPALNKLNVTVNNVSAGIVEGATVLLYDSKWNCIDKKQTVGGIVSWVDLPTNLFGGTYKLEAYFNGEFWANDEIAMGTGESSLVLQRNRPYVPANGFNVLEVNSNIAIGSAVYTVTVHNDTQAPQQVRVRFRADQDWFPPYDFPEVVSVPQTIAPGGTSDFVFNHTPAQAGVYYSSFEVETFVNNQFAKTDSWAWGKAFTATEVNPKGLTIITHGFMLDGNFPDWPIAMANEIVARKGGGGKVIKLDFDSGLAYECTGRVCNTPANQVALAGTGETVIVLDWSGKSNNQTSAADAVPGWREAAGDFLANFLLGTGFAQAANNIQAPIHFIAHSYGTVVISEAIRRLGVHKITVDQMTTLDPHDQDQLTVPDAKNDPQVSVWSNVIFADNYWEDNVGDRGNPYDGSSPVLPVGRWILGTIERDLTTETSYGSGELLNQPHSRIHEWYYKTIYGEGEPGGHSDRQGYYQDALGNVIAPTMHGFSLTNTARRNVGVWFPELQMHEKSAAFRRDEALIPYEAVFNGDFSFSEQTAQSLYTLPGYVDSGRPWVVIDSSSNHGGVAELSLSLFGGTFTHKDVYFPSNAKYLSFSYNVVDRGGAGNYLELTDLGNFGLSTTLDLSALPSGWQTINIPVPPALLEKAVGFRFYINNPMLGLGSASARVWIDDIKIISQNTVPSALTITTTASPMAGGITSGGGSVTSGSSVTLVATANAGYGFVNWTENGVTVSPAASYTFTVTAAKNLVANFAAVVPTVTHSLTINATDASNMPISLSPLDNNGVADAVPPFTRTYNHNTTVTLAAPSSWQGVSFLHWLRDGAIVSTSAATTITMDANHTMTVVYGAVQPVTYSVSVTGATGGVVTGGGTYAANSSVTVTALPSTGYSFVNWTENGAVVSSVTNYTFTVNANRNLVANFVAVATTYTLNVSATNGTVAKSPDQASYSSGSQVMLTATPASGYTFSGWSGGCTGMGTCVVMMTADTTIIATFTNDTTAPTGFITINSGAASTNSTSVTLNLSASDIVGVTGYYVSTGSSTPSSSASGWTSITSTISYSADASYTLSSGDGTKTVYVWYKDVAGNVSVNASVSITLATTTTDIIPPTDGTLTASAGSGQVSLNWSGFSDSGGIAGYNLVYSTTSTPSSCSAGTQIYSGTGSSYVHTGLINNTTYFYRLCATDNAGNTSAGVSVSKAPGFATLIVNKSGSGTVTGGNSINCGSNCSETGAINSVLNLTTTADNGWAITGWSDGKTTYSNCEKLLILNSLSAARYGGSGYYTTFSCSVTLDQDTTISVTFADTTPTTGTISINSDAASTNFTTATLTISCTDANGCSQMQFSNDNSTWSTAETYTTSKAWTLSSGDGTKTVYVKFKDGAGNWSGAFSTNITLDTAVPVFTSTAPAASGYINTATVGYTLNKTVLSGSVTMTWTGGNADATSPHVYNLTASDMTSGSHTVNTGFILVNGAVYTVSFDALDAAGNAAETVSNTNITFDAASASATISSPASGSRVNNSNVGYTLSEAISSGDIVFTATGGNADAASPHIYTLAGGELAAGAHSVSTGMTLVDGAVYTVIIENVFDAAGNSTATVSNTNITYDSTSVAITNTTPAASSTIATATVSYTLSEQAASGGVTFTRTGGSADAGSPHTYTLTGADLYSGVHTVDTGLGLVDGAIYTVSFDATDMAGNPATTASSAMVNYDDKHSLSVNITGSGSVASDMTGIDCGTDCNEVYNHGTTITLTATPNIGSAFTGWSGGCTGTGTCSVVMTADTTIIATFNNDITAPTGTISINSGAAYSNSTAATLTLSCTDTNGCAQMQFSNDNTTWSTAEAYATSKTWALATGDGTKTVYVKFNDSAGNWSTAYSGSIILDISAPTTTASPAGGTYSLRQSVILTCSDGTGSGCDKIYYTTDGTTPTTTSTVYSTAISISATTTLKFFAKDLAGNSETMKTETYIIATTTYTATPSAGVGGTISPATAQTVNSGSTTSFTVTPNSGYSISSVTGCGGILSGNTYTTVAITADCSVAATFASGNTIPPAFTSTSPAANSHINKATVGYTLSSAVFSGKITFARTGGSTDSASHIYNFTDSDKTVGTHSVNTGLSLVNGAIYSVTFEATDIAGNAATLVSNTGVVYDNTSASVVINSPSSNSRTNSVSVGYTLNEDITSADILFTRTGGTADGLSPHKYTLAVSERTSGSHMINTGVTLIDSAIYTVGFENIMDKGGNATASVSHTNITYDSTAVAITNTTPASNAIITNSTVGYTLSEAASSGKVTFTRSGGSPDSGSPHIYTLSGSDLYVGSHSVNTTLSVVNGAFYTVSFDATDFAGNPATTVSNAMVYYESNYGAGPEGNVDYTLIDGKQRVDGLDLIIISIAFGSKPGDANWNPVCDINKEGSSNNYIDGLDMTTLGKHFGEVQ